jgi:hypothetical protein
MSAAVPPPGAPAPDADGAARGAGGLGALARLLAAECEAQVPPARCWGARVRWLQGAALRRVCWVARHGRFHFESAPALTHLAAAPAAGRPRAPRSARERRARQCIPQLGRRLYLLLVCKCPPQAAHPRPRARAGAAGRGGAGGAAAGARHAGGRGPAGRARARQRARALGAAQRGVAPDGAPRRSQLHVCCCRRGCDLRWGE